MLQFEITGESKRSVIRTIGQINSLASTMSQGIVAISGGHHTAKALVIGENGDPFVVCGESLNLHNHGYKTFIHRLRTLLTNVEHQARDLNTDVPSKRWKVVMALPGVSSEQDLELGEVCLRACGWDDPGLRLIQRHTNASKSN